MSSPPPCRLLEVCVDSVESAEAAAAGGAMRIELCSALSKGGLTPTPSLLRVIKTKINIPVYCMIRPRGGPMIFSEAETEVILGEVKDLVQCGADGLVFGALTSDGEIDVELCSKFKQAAGAVPCTFHRAFDLVKDPMNSLRIVMDLNFQRILTSGCEKTALDGASLIKQLTTAAEGRIIVMAGAGINANNIAQIIKATGVIECHGSAKVKKLYSSPSVSMGSEDDSELWVTSAAEVASIIKEMIQCSL